MEPSGLAFGKPKDRLRDIRGCGPHVLPHFASLNAGYHVSPRQILAHRVKGGPWKGFWGMRIVP